MAILLANYDLDRDYLSNFEPFVIDRIKEWADGSEVRPKALAEEMTKAYHLPPIPLNTVTDLRNRAQRDGYLIDAAGSKHLPNRGKLDERPPLAAEKNEFLGHFNHVAKSIASYARSIHGLDWTRTQAEEALEQFVDEFSVELAVAKRTGDLGSAPTLERNEALTVVHGFARHALSEDPTNLQYLEEVVQASMLTNVLYFQDLGSWRPEFNALVAYLDTTVGFRVLGLTDPEVSEAAQEMVSLLGAFNVPVRVFEHTVVEMEGVLNGIEHNLRTIRTRGMPDLEKLARQGQEVLSHAIREGWTPADVKEVIANLEKRLADQEVQKAPTPAHARNLTLDESRLEEILIKLKFRRKGQREKDIQSLTAIHILRGGRSFRQLGEAKAIFVTSNERVVRAGNWWFSDEGKRSPVPQCISDISLTTQLWLRKPESRPEVARKFLIAESFAALNPSPELWERYLSRIAQRHDRGEITEEEVKVLVFSAEAKEGLMEVTHGNPDHVDEEVVGEVLARYQGQVRAPLVKEVGQAKMDSDELRSELASRDVELGEQKERLASQDRQLGDQQEELDKLVDAEQQRAERRKTRERRRRLARRIVGVPLAILVLAATFDAWLADWVSEPVGRAAVGFAGACIAMMLFAFALSKTWRWAVSAMVVSGSFLAVFFGLVAVADQTNPTDQSGPSKGHTRHASIK
ncbi:MAG: hypothetical protein JJE35_04215 [Thermoleophilia bacterium]|nr:hypothetical protein [Thermoleophilia bacterium]